MPPKKGPAAKAKASATPKKSIAAAPEPPATVTSNRGKEYDTTAAAARPRRSIANETATSVPSKAKANGKRTP
ncbi:hypothetical protein Tdes44962_MAKER00755 [Teratosphaeria destructans]|uniref:Uncharacterized protein n=1 Tax=Teratosphaeria destructans TaxID=418781 RepID=A0A9W7SM53_9PEZI|nr:hypothetical protein Tdes44962_MAKER00755 [Teratosphaeria destructans]